MLNPKPHKMKQMIARSWERCQSFRVPIERKYAPSAAKIDLLLQEKNRQALYQQALPSLQRVSSHLENTDYSLILTDQEGIVLYNDGDIPIKNELERLNLWPGGVWSEAEAGTNAMGTTLLEKRPTLILGEEHYCIGWKPFSCAGHPIFDGRGKIYAVVDVTGFAKRFSPGTAMALAASVAENIQGELIRKEMEDRILLHSAYLDRRIQVHHDLLFAVHHSGEIISFPPGRLKEFMPLLKQLHEKVLHQKEEGKSAFLEGEIPFQGVSVEYRLTLVRKERRDIGFLVQLTVSNLSGADQQKIRKIDPALQKKIAHPSESGLMHRPPVPRKSPIIQEEIDPVLEKPLDHDRIPAPRGIRSIRDSLSPPFRNLLSRSSQWNELLLKAERAAKTDHSILLIGESGTGKELLAHAIHDSSQRRKGPFVPINCGAIPSDLAVSLLFGYASGAFTGALKEGKEGAFEAAKGGTLFLDEIGELPPEVQKMLLRVLQEREVLRLGEQQATKVDVRIIAATNRDLQREVEAGHFRSDLFYRLFILPLFLPPLRERREDIPELIERFLSEGERPGLKWSGEVIQFFGTYEWPGNIRELKNTIAYIKTFAPQQEIQMKDLPEWLLSRKGQFSSSSSQLRFPRDESIIPGKKQIENVKPAEKNQGEETPPVRPPITPQNLQALLLQYHYNLSKVAKYLSISRGTLYRYLRKFNLSRKSTDEP